MEGPVSTNKYYQGRNQIAHFTSNIEGKHKIASGKRSTHEDREGEARGDGTKQV